MGTTFAMSYEGGEGYMRKSLPEARGVVVVVVGGGVLVRRALGGNIGGDIALNKGQEGLQWTSIQGAVQLGVCRDNLSFIQHANDILLGSGFPLLDDDGRSVGGPGGRRVGNHG